MPRMTEIDTVLVLGGTGKVGRRLLPRLAERGVVARAASRHPGPDGIAFDWSRRETHRPALTGVDAVFLVMPNMVADPSPLTGPFLEQAREAGTRRVVLLSSLGVALQAGAMAGFAKVEDQVRASDLAWTILQPSGFDQNFSEGFLLPAIREHGIIPAPTGDGRAPLVDANDVAAVAAVALTEQGHAKAEYAITGPEAITFAEAAAAISAAAGKPVVHQDIPRPALLDILQGHGAPADYAEMVVSTFDAIRNDEAAQVSPHVEQVTGHAATSFADFVDRSADVWT
jgi:uncharacterized protein YbjT (DUF2867 family)